MRYSNAIYSLDFNLIIRQNFFFLKRELILYFYKSGAILLQASPRNWLAQENWEIAKQTAHVLRNQRAADCVTRVTSYLNNIFTLIKNRFFLNKIHPFFWPLSRGSLQQQNFALVCGSVNRCSTVQAIFFLIANR